MTASGYTAERTWTKMLMILPHLREDTQRQVSEAIFSARSQAVASHVAGLLRCELAFRRSCAQHARIKAWRSRL
eukprot:1743217-Amphidinium_carterae.1